MYAYMIFFTTFLSSKETSWYPDSYPKFLSKMDSKKFRVYDGLEYSINMYSFILRILQRCTLSFCVFGDCAHRALMEDLPYSALFGGSIYNVYTVLIYTLYT